MANITPNTKKIHVEFFYEARGFQTFDVPLNYVISSSSQSDAYHELMTNFISNVDMYLEHGPVDIYECGGSKGVFKRFGDFIESNNEQLQVVDFELVGLINDLKEETEDEDEDF
jgi:hypothetical protein